MNPHEDDEGTYRAGLVYRFNSKTSSELSMMGSTVLSGAESGKTYLSVSPELDVRLAKFLYGRLGFEFPVSPDRRFDWRAALGLQSAF